ncbi:MAG TPA: RlmE family RNA methyltransferase [Caulobacteraceae bacterium]
MSEEPPRKRLVRAPTRGGDDGRNDAVRVRMQKGRTPSSKAWLERQLNDDFVQAAKARGYRSRAAFKLAEIDQRFHLLKPGVRVVDLGCAPGGWIQIAIERGAISVVGVDLLHVDPLPPARILEMDFTDPACGEMLIERLGGTPDIILSDMAPNTTGHRTTDHLRIIGLVEQALDFAIQTLKPGGAFVTKAFQGGETAEVAARLKRHFASVRHVKPKASRPESSELYLVAAGFGRRPGKA